MNRTFASGFLQEIHRKQPFFQDNLQITLLIYQPNDTIKHPTKHHLPQLYLGWLAGLYCLF